MQSTRKLRRLVLAGLMALGTYGLSTTAFAADAGLHVDQVGYLTNHTKVAMVSAASGDSFKLVDVKTGKTVYEGKLTAAKYDANSAENIRRADFTNFNTPGEYKLVVGDKESYDFAIGDNVYNVPLVQNLRSYTLARSGNPFKDEVTGLEVKQGHAQDARAKTYFGDKLNQKGDILDVSGGWYDAGDYGKYTTTAGLASAEIMLAYEANPTHFTKGQLHFPKGVKSDGKLPDVLAEVKHELKWMQKMQRSDGSTFHKVAGAQWPGFDKSPDTDTQERFVYGTATYSTAIYGASMAIAARVFYPYDKEYAEELLKSAKASWNYLEKTNQPVYRWDEGQESGSGPYDKKTDEEERLWLAAELFRTTGDKAYEKYLQNKQAVFTKKPGFFTWDNTLSLAQFAYLTNNAADKSLQGKVKTAFLAYADDIVKKIEKDGFASSLSAGEYTWASTKNALSQGDHLLMANQIAPNKKYVEGALDQLHYLFGRNVLNRSFMTGVGDNPPEHPHNRIHESTGAYVPGLVVGGPNAVSGGDPDQTKYLESGNIPPAKAYLDVLTSWSTNEYAIDYNSAAAYALAFFAKADSSIKAADLKLNRAFPPLNKNK